MRFNAQVLRLDSLAIHYWQFILMLVIYVLKLDKHLGGGETLPGVIAPTLQWTDIQARFFFAILILVMNSVYHYGRMPQNLGVAKLNITPTMRHR